MRSGGLEAWCFVGYGEGCSKSVGQPCLLLDGSYVPGTAIKTGRHASSEEQQMGLSRDAALDSDRHVGVLLPRQVSMILLRYRRGNGLLACDQTDERKSTMISIAQSSG